MDEQEVTRLSRTPDLGGIGLWGGFLDLMPPRAACEMVAQIATLGYSAVWLPEWSGVDPFIRASLYLASSETIAVGIGVANIHGRDPSAMYAAASTLEEAFPGRVIVGMGVSHRPAVEERGHEFTSPIATMSHYIEELEVLAHSRPMPAMVLGALGPRMTKLSTMVGGAHTYLGPVDHTVESRKILGPGPWLGPSLMIASADDQRWREWVRKYLKMSLGLPSYRSHLMRFGFSPEEIDSREDRLVDALAVTAGTGELQRRTDQHRRAGADHVVLQVIPVQAAASSTDVMTAAARELELHEWESGAWG